ncbi:hypothetical protein BBP40_010006 [Aspergillus hancockii]|nr:hypothetical protein BBP40_010006 [Aspergillus hancockii]
MPIDMNTLSPEQLDGKIQMLREEANGATHDYEERLFLLHHLGNILCYRFSRTGNSPIHYDDVEEAVRCGREVIQNTPIDHPDRAQRLEHYGNALSYRFGIRREMVDLEGAGSMLRECVEMTGLNDVSRSQRLNNLAVTLWQIFRVQGTLGELDEAICLAEKSMLLNAQPSPELWNNLGVWTFVQYEHTREAGRLQAAIDALKTALQRADSSDRVKPGVLNNLGLALYDRFERTNQTRDLDDAIFYQQEALRLQPTSPQWSSNLSRSFGAYFLRHGSREKLDLAVGSSEAASALIPDDHPDRAGILANHGLWLGERARVSHSESDLETAICACHKALSLNMKTYSRATRRIVLNTLGSLLALRYEWNDRIEDLNEAISRQRESLAQALENHAQSGKVLFNLGTYLDARYKSLSQPQDHEDAKSYFGLAFQNPTSSPLDRIKAGVLAGLHYLDDREWDDASSIYQKAVGLLAELNPQTLSHEDQLYVFSELTGLSTLAAAATLQAGGTAFQALRILEEGRGMVSSIAINSKSDITYLRDWDQALYEEYLELRERLSLPLPSHDALSEVNMRYIILAPSPDRFDRVVANAVDQRHRHLEAFNGLENRIRTIPGLEGFHRPPSLGELTGLAAEGSIVSFNVTGFRSDALMITSKGVRSIRLGALHFDELRDNVQCLIGTERLSLGRPSTRARRNKRLKGILQWLWDVAVCPVFTELGLSGPANSDRLHRVFWLTSGLMGLTPLHAAGKIRSDSSDNAFSHAVSTYVPTLKSLLYSRRGVAEPLVPSEQVIQIISRAETPGLNPLNVEAEVAAMQDAIRPYNDIAIHRLESPDRQHALKAIQSSPIVHFACHGESNAQDPSSGGLFLGNIAEGKPDLMSISDVASVTHPQAYLAYLSACSTAENSAIHLMDEAIHVASAFQLVGYRNVIGTLWEANDKTSIRVVKLFYELASATWCNSSAVEGSNAIAYALHDAVATLRNDPLGGMKKIIDDPILWVPFIHVGT